jgi:hypothetical protein
MEIPSDNRIRHVPRRVHCHAQGFLLEVFWDFYVGSGSRSPELYSVSADWFGCEIIAQAYTIDLDVTFGNEFNCSSQSTAG